MTESRVKDPALAARLTDGELEWQRRTMPLTEMWRARVAARDFRGKRLAVWMHIVPNGIDLMLALRQAGAEVVVGACNRDSTDDATAAWLAARGIPTLAWSGMTAAEYDDALREVVSFGAEYLCDMGGELIAASIGRSPAPRAALEATTSGRDLLRGRDLTFPVFDWNSIPLKERIENRFHVGDGVWPAFTHLTGMSLFGRRVLVVGYGPVGIGIAERARDLGAIVAVADLDPVRLVEARYHGCMAMGLEEGMAWAHAVVTATGSPRVLGERVLLHARPGAILLNAGHTSDEIDVDWLRTRPHRRLKPHVDSFEVEAGREVFLLANGSIVNLAGAAGPHGNDLFDHYTAIMLQGVEWMFDGKAEAYPAGLHLYPVELEREIAAASVEVFGGT